MNNDDSFFNQIDDFLTGKLSTSAQEAMQQAIAEHRDLAQEVEMRRLEFDLSESLIADDIRIQLSKLRTGSMPKPAKKSWSIRTTLMFFVGIIVFLGAGLFWVFHRPPMPSPLPVSTPDIIIKDSIKTPETIGKDTVHQPSPALPSDNSKLLALATSIYTTPDFESLRGSAPNPSELDKALEAWRIKDYSTVLKEAKRIKKTSPLYIKSRYLLAHACFLCRDFNQAAAIFSVIADAKIQPYSEESDWYVIPALLASTPFQKSVLDTRMDHILKNPQHSWYEECKQLTTRIQVR